MIHQSMRPPWSRGSTNSYRIHPDFADELGRKEKELLSQAQDLGTIEVATKPGWRTTEFWLAVIPLGALLLLLGLGRITPEDISSLWPLLVSAGGYGISRGLAK